MPAGCRSSTTRRTRTTPRAPTASRGQPCDRSENFFGDDVWTFNATTSALEGGLPIAPRTYHSFSAMADDVVEARMLLGIHFRFADEVARRQGKQSADRTFARVLQPID